MTRSTALAALALGLAPLAHAQTPATLDAPDLVRQYQATITPAELAGHLYVYASDYFEGRETATRGQRLAALYLAGQYQTMGLRPEGTATASGPHDPAVYLQPFALDREVVRRAALTVQNGGPSSTTAFGTEGSDGDLYLMFGNDGAAEGGLVFGGYGIATDRYDDYAAMEADGLSPAGQWLLLLPGEPTNADGTSRISADGTPTAFARNVFQKVRTAMQKGMPAGILLVADEAEQTVAEQAAARLQALGGLSLPTTGEEARAPRPIPPVYVVSRAFADRLLAPSGRTVAGLAAAIDGPVEPVVFAVDGTTVSSSVTKGTETVMAENVAALVEGSDPVLKDEVIVVSAHLDHIGMDPTATGDGINNGADDDGSGTVALLEMAEAFKQAKEAGHGPRRSVLFLHVTGEEKGLLGSEYYADVEPLLPLASTVANLNIDMIGRHDPTYEGAASPYVYIIGAELISTEIDQINTSVNDATGLGIDLSKRYNSPDDPNRFFARSDHWNFGKHDIPFIFYFTGTHEDYHRPGDEPQKIDYDRMAQITRLVFGTAWQIANQDARPAVSGIGFN